MVEGDSGVRASVGFASETGLRACNEDFAGAVFGNELPTPRQEVVAAIADGIGGAKGGRVAAETAVRGFLGWILRPAGDPGSSARGSEGLGCTQRLDPFPVPARPGTQRDGMHFHSAHSAWPHCACAACRRHALLQASRRPPDLLDPRPRPGSWLWAARHSLPRWVSRMRYASTMPHSRSRCMIASCCAAMVCTGSCQMTTSRIFFANAVRPVIARDLLSMPPSARTPPTIARHSFWTWLRSRWQHPLTSELV